MLVKCALMTFIFTSYIGPVAASDCNPGRKEPPRGSKATDSTDEKPVYKPKF